MAQNIEILIDNDGIIKNPRENIVEKRVVIRIEIHEEIKRRIMEQNKKISFCDDFLNEKNFQFIEFIDNAGVEIIGNQFLCKCKELSNIDLSGLSNVTQIGNSFIYSCHNLKHINLSQLSKITKIGDYFLSDCSGLKDVNLSGLFNLTQLGCDFLYECSSLTNIDLSGLLNLKKIDDNFLTLCSSLTNIDLSGLSKVTQIGEFFLSDCSSLTSVDLRQLLNLTKIGILLLDNCDNLNLIKIIPHQEAMLLTNDKDLLSKIEIDNEWYNSFEGEKWIRKTIQKSNNIQDSDILLNLIDYI
jgi:hypothetical protein